MSKFDPFADDDASLTIDKLTVENGFDKIALYGSLDLTRDKKGLAQARALKAILDQAIAALTEASDLPDRIAPDASSKTVRNPFE